jgi:transmembrane sensor
MTQQDFNNLSKRYLNGETTPEENRYLEEWFNKQPEEVLIDIDNSQKEEIGHRMLQNIRREAYPTRQRFKLKLIYASGIAAMLVIGVFWYLNTSTPQNFLTSAVDTASPTGIEMKNNTSTEQEVKLEDGSKIILKPNSSFICSKEFNLTKREVYLKGEAFFDIKRDVTRPFIVHVDELVTEVFGTSFRIKANPKTKAVEVTVISGKVSVYIDKQNQTAEKNGIILTRNQKVVFDSEAKNIVPSIVDKPLPITAKQNENVKERFVFQMVPLETVLKQLSDIYGIEFIIANSNVKNCMITADLNGLSMFTQIELICKSIDATYDKRGTVVFIYGDGCQ